MKRLILIGLVAMCAVTLRARNVSEDVIPQQDDTSAVVLTLEDALKVALSENISVKVADKEIQRATYAKKGTYAALFPQVDANASFQRTIKKQVMYMDFDMSSLGIGGGAPSGADAGGAGGGAGSGGGLEVGRWNTWSAGVTAAMPIINAQLWEAVKISGDDVELAVEKARGSRLGMVSEVKSAFFAVLFAKEAFKVYQKVYENAQKNLDVTQMRYNAQKASELDLTRAKTTVANAVPQLYNAGNTLDLSLWQLKAVMGVDLNYNMDVAGSLEDYAQQMFYDINSQDTVNLSRNTSLKQMDIQIMELSRNVRMNKFAYIPTLAVAFNYSYNAMANDFVFKEYKWTPYSYVGLSLNIPIFSGMKRLNAVRQSKVQLEQVQLQRIQAERSLRIAVRADLGTMESNMKSYYAAQSAVQAAQKGYDISEVSYQVGRSTLVELNDAMVMLAQAQLSQWQSVYSFLVAKCDLEEQLGQDYTIAE